MKPISNEIRANIIEAKKRKEPVTKIMEWFNICRKSIERIWNTYNATGSYEPKPFPGKQSIVFTDEINNQIMKLVEEQPDITQEEIIEILSLEVTQPALCRQMKKIGLTLKKRLFMQQEYKKKKLLKEEKNLK